jgi:hypothetical protein
MNQTTDPTATTSRPWHREPMVWLMLAIPALTVVGGFVTLWLAMAQPVEVVGPEVMEQIAKPAPHAP